MIFASLSLLSAGIVETVQIKNIANTSSVETVQIKSITNTSNDSDISPWLITHAPLHVFMGASLVFVIPAGISVYHWSKNEVFLMTQQTITCSIKALEKGVKYI